MLWVQCCECNAVGAMLGVQCCVCNAVCGQEFWPDTDHGLQPPGGNPTIGEEPHIVPLTWGGYQVLMRTSQGYMGSVVSSIDPKLPWGTTQYARYAPIKGPEGAASPLYNNNTWWVKQPRGPLTPKRQPNGMVLMSFNHNAGFASFAAATPIMDRSRSTRARTESRFPTLAG